jgi:hypothetical protein
VGCSKAALGQNAMMLSIIERFFTITGTCMASIFHKGFIPNTVYYENDDVLILYRVQGAHVNELVGNEWRTFEVSYADATNDDIIRAAALYHPHWRTLGASSELTRGYVLMHGHDRLGEVRTRWDLRWWEWESFVSGEKGQTPTFLDSLACVEKQAKLACPAICVY